MDILQTDAPRIGNPQMWDKVHGGGGGEGAPGGPPAMQQGPPAVQQQYGAVTPMQLQQAAYGAPGGYGAPPPASGPYGGGPGAYGGPPPNQGASFVRCA